MTTLVFDIECDGLLDTVTQVHCIVTMDADTKEIITYDPSRLREGIKALERADHIIGHNIIGYDIPVLQRLHAMRTDRGRVIDTLVLSRLGRPVRNGGHSLAAWGERFDYPKVVHEDWTTFSPEMLNRCVVDVEITQKLWELLKPMYDLMPDAIGTDHKVAWAVADMVKRGFTLDVDYARKVLDEKMTRCEQMLRDFQETFPPVLVPKQPCPKVYKTIPKSNPMHGIAEVGVPFTPLEVQEFSPTARQQVATRLIQKYGWKPKKLTATGIPEVSEDILRELDYPEAKAFADYLAEEKLVQQLNALPRANGNGGGWLYHVREDNRVHPSFNPTGANTHRSSCSSPNLQQVASAPEMRKCWIPCKGWKLVGIDAAGLELRCLAHYLAPLDGGQYADILINGDIHAHVQKLIGFATREKTKNAEYGWLYGAGDAKLGQIARQDAQHSDIVIDKRINNTKLGRALRNNLQKGITGLEELVNGVKKKAHTGRLTGLDKRPLWVRSEHSALNLLLQSCGAIIIKTAWSLMYDELLQQGLYLNRDYAVVIQVHDEWQIEAREDCAEQVGLTVVDSIKKAGEKLGFRCPLDGTYNIGRNWHETH